MNDRQLHLVMSHVQKLWRRHPDKSFGELMDAVIASLPAPERGLGSLTDLELAPYLRNLELE